MEEPEAPKGGIYDDELPKNQTGPIDNSSNPVFGDRPSYGGPGMLDSIFKGGLYVQQDNDQISNITGNGNTVTQNQDNSVSASGVQDFKKRWMDYKFK